MKKRILSILLTLCMVLTMMPATVFAADEGVLLPLKPDIAGQYRTSADNFLKTSLQNKRF